jgi:hypothetical protein
MSRAPSFCPDPEGEEVKNMNNITKTKKKEITPREIRTNLQQHKFPPPHRLHNPKKADAT